MKPKLTKAQRERVLKEFGHIPTKEEVFAKIQASQVRMMNALQEAFENMPEDEALRGQFLDTLEQTATFNKHLNEVVKTPGKTKKACFLCGKTKKLIKTECCGQWICNDEDAYQLFSYSDVSCHRNHRRYTLCSHHFAEGHAGKWQTCKQCRKDFDTEMYVWYGTNEYSFEKLPKPPTFKPTHCAKCKQVIRRGEEGYTSCPDGTFLCEVCGQEEMDKLMKLAKAKR